MKPETVKRYKAFWAHEETDRPILSVTVPDQTAAWDAHALAGRRAHGYVG